MPSFYIHNYDSQRPSYCPSYITQLIVGPILLYITKYLTSQKSKYFYKRTAISFVSSYDFIILSRDEYPNAPIVPEKIWL